MQRVKLELEYIMRASPTILYQFLTSPDYLIRWFCDSADENEEVFVFEWEGFEEVANVEEEIPEELIRFKWEDADDEDEYFEFKIDKSPITNETILQVTDFCDADEEDTQTSLWNNQIDKLRRAMGA